nr:endonuclease NucS domain-containing protein [Halococcus hamelinensis]
MVALVGKCEVEYDGRAASYLPPGERVVVLEPDGTLLVPSLSRSLLGSSIDTVLDVRCSHHTSHSATIVATVDCEYLSSGE